MDSIIVRLNDILERPDRWGVNLGGSADSFEVSARNVRAAVDHHDTD